MVVWVEVWTEGLSLDGFSSVEVVKREGVEKRD